MNRTCAVCVDEIPAGEILVSERLGRGGRLVTVCRACRELPASDGRYSFDSAPAQGARPMPGKGRSNR